MKVESEATVVHVAQDDGGRGRATEVSERLHPRGGPSLPAGDEARFMNGGRRVAPGAREYAHYFPFLQRDDSLGPTVHEFRPERWLEPTLDAAASASNLFLRGPRACPGMDLILFVCKTAIARQLAELGVSARQERLTRDPLPISFPKMSGRFTTSR